MTFEECVQTARQYATDDVKALELGGLLLEKELLKKELASKELEKQVLLLELTAANAKLIKLQGILSVRSAWEWFETQRSPRKQRNSQLPRMDTWNDLAGTQIGNSLMSCFALPSKDPSKAFVTRALALYAKLSIAAHTPDLDCVIIERSKYDAEELCMLRKMFEEVKIPYEEWELGKMVASFPAP